MTASKRRYAGSRMQGVRSPRTMAPNSTIYKGFESRVPLKFQFATPDCFLERGSNEHMNERLRQYLPKGVIMERLWQDGCDRIGTMLNARPRKRFY